MLMPSLMIQSDVYCTECTHTKFHLLPIAPYASVKSYGVKLCSPLSLTLGLIGLNEIMASILLYSVLLLGFVGKCFEKTS